MPARLPGRIPVRYKAVVNGKINLLSGHVVLRRIIPCLPVILRRISAAARIIAARIIASHIIVSRIINAVLP